MSGVATALAIVGAATAANAAIGVWQTRLRRRTVEARAAAQEHAGAAAEHAARAATHAAEAAEYYRLATEQRRMSTLLAVVDNTRFAGLWIEPLDGRAYRWRCCGCDWSLDQGHGDAVPDALTDFLMHWGKDHWPWGESDRA